MAVNETRITRRLLSSKGVHSTTLKMHLFIAVLRHLKHLLLQPLPFYTFFV